MTTYNPKNFQVSVNALPVTGYDDGTDVIKTEYLTDFVDSKVGVTGEAAFVESNDRRGMLTLKLLATATQNDVFSALAASGVEFAVGITDSGGTTTMVGAAARFAKIPNMDKGNEIGGHEWVIKILEMIMHLGGGEPLFVASAGAPAQA